MIRTRLTRVAIAAGLGLAAVPAVASAPAHAAARQVVITHSVTVPGQVVHVISVSVLTSSQAEAQNYINTGSTITVRCYGDDPILNDDLHNVPKSNVRPAKYSGASLTTTATGKIRLVITSLYDHGHELNEDFEGDDEIFCSAEFKGSDGVLLYDESDEVSGDF